MFINIARIAWAFNISEKPNEPIDICKSPVTLHSWFVADSRLFPPVNFTPGFLSAPRPFKVDIKPRDENVVKVLKEELTEAETIFQQFED